jgi:hypothetical protein
MQSRAILVTCSSGLLFVAACEAGGATVPRVTPCYDEFTRRLVALYADQDGDGRTDQWSYFDGNRPLRGETDTDADGRIDRWEYFTADAGLEKIGSSSHGDGIEDTWSWPAGADGVARVDLARGRDRRIDRREYFVNGVLARAEEDTNGDGRTDRWDRYEGSVLRQAEFDTTLAAGRPNRRVLYDAAGHFQRVEMVER